MKKYAEKFVGITPKDYKMLGIPSRYKFERILDVGCGDRNFSVLLKEACRAKKFLRRLEDDKRNLILNKLNELKT